MKSSSTTKTPLKSILKSPAVSPGSSPKNTSGVHFEPPPNLEETLKAAAENNLRGEELDGFITHMKNQKGGALVDWLQQVQMNLTMLKPSLETFVLAILSISWADQERPVVTAYKNFLENLISSQSYYTKPVIRSKLHVYIIDYNKSSIGNRYHHTLFWGRGQTPPPLDTGVGVWSLIAKKNCPPSES